MFSKKKWLTMLSVIIVVLILGACGDKEESGQTVEAEHLYNNSRNHTAEDFMPISEGLEKYSVWFETSEEIVRDSTVYTVFVFKNGEVTVYDFEDTTVEDIYDLTDDEIIQLASEFTNKTLDELENNINNTSISESVKEKHDSSFEDIYLEFDGGERATLSSKYTLDIIIDELGQNTQTINLTIPEAYYQLSSNSVTQFDASIFEAIFSDYYVYTTHPNYNHTVETYGSLLESLQEYGSFVAKDGQELTDPPQPETYVPDPIVWETTGEIISLTRDSVNQTIFDTTFSGIKTENGSLITRVDDSFVGFKLDSPDTDKKNVTIEGK